MRFLVIFDRSADLATPIFLLAGKFVWAPRIIVVDKETLTLDSESHFRLLRMHRTFIIFFGHIWALRTSNCCGTAPAVERKLVLPDLSSLPKVPRSMFTLHATTPTRASTQVSPDLFTMG